MVKCAVPECPNLAKQSATGRPGNYCSDRCRLRAFRRKGRESETKLGETKLPDILFYCGVNETSWNHHPMETGTHICVAPVTTTTKKDPATGQKIRVLRNTNVFVDPTKVTHVLLDSGAFSDGIELQDGQVVKSHRLSFEKALQRQLLHAYKYHYLHQVEALVSYDLLIDETWLHGERSKMRWSAGAAEYAVQETIAAAHYLSTQRRRVDAFFGHPVKLCLSAQGIEASQYAYCTGEIVKLMKPDDLFGLGGFCITGLKRHFMLPAAGMILPPVFEILGRAGVKRVHVFGVIIPALLGLLLSLSTLYGMQLSTDSSGPCTEPAKNGNWGYGSWTNPRYEKAPVLASCSVLDEQGNKAPTCSPQTRCVGLERCRHTQLTRDYLAHFREREPDLVGPLPLPIDCPVSGEKKGGD